MKFHRSMNILKMKKRIYFSVKELSRGFSIVELLVVIVVLAILLSTVASASYGYMASARDSERANDIDGFSRGIEQYYRTQSVATGATYPSSATIIGLAETITDKDLIKAPDEASSSLVVATGGGAQTPTDSQYIYQPLKADGSLCAALPCPRYKLYYRLETTGDVIVKNSLRQQ